MISSMCLIFRLNLTPSSCRVCMVNGKWEQVIEKQRRPKNCGVEPVSETDYYLFHWFVHGFIDSLNLLHLSF